MSLFLSPSFQGFLLRVLPDSRRRWQNLLDSLSCRLAFRLIAGGFFSDLVHLRHSFRSFWAQSEYMIDLLAYKFYSHNHLRSRYLYVFWDQNEISDQALRKPPKSMGGGSLCPFWTYYQIEHVPCEEIRAYKLKMSGRAVLKHFILVPAYQPLENHQIQ